MGAVALVNLRFFFEVEEVHRCCCRALRCSVLFWLLGVNAVAAQRLFVADAANRSK